jgi:hypothetical protein
MRMGTVPRLALTCPLFFSYGWRQLLAFLNIRKGWPRLTGTRSESKCRHYKRGAAAGDSPSDRFILFLIRMRSGSRSPPTSTATLCKSSSSARNPRDSRQRTREGGGRTSRTELRHIITQYRSCSACAYDISMQDRLRRESATLQTSGEDCGSCLHCWQSGASCGKLESR